MFVVDRGWQGKGNEILGCFLWVSESNSESKFLKFFFYRKWILNGRIENPGFLPTRS